MRLRAYKNFILSKNPALGNGPFEREFKLVTMPLKELMDREFQSRFLTLRELIGECHIENYWGARFLERWTLNRWPLRRSRSTEIQTLGSLSLTSSNHNSLSEEE